MDSRTLSLFCTRKEIKPCHWIVLGGKPKMLCRHAVSEMRLATSLRTVRGGHIMYNPLSRHEFTPRDTYKHRTRVRTYASREPTKFPHTNYEQLRHYFSGNRARARVKCAFLLNLSTATLILSQPFTPGSPPMKFTVMSDQIRSGARRLRDYLDLGVMRGFSC